MKVYIRKWYSGSGWQEVGIVKIDSYNGLNFTDYEENKTETTRLERVKNIFLHASEPNCLVVYVEEVTQ